MIRVFLRFQSFFEVLLWYFSQQISKIFLNRQKNSTQTNSSVNLFTCWLSWFGVPVIVIILKSKNNCLLSMVLCRFTCTCISIKLKSQSNSRETASVQAILVYYTSNSLQGLAINETFLTFNTKEALTGTICHRESFQCFNLR